MRISDIYGNNQISNQSRTVAGQDGTLPRQTGGESSGNLKDLTPGQMIRGEVVTSENGEIQLKLSNGSLLNAKLDQELPLEMGKSIQFQVRSNGQSLTLTPLQENLSMEGPVAKALDMANLPANSATGELTRLLMQAGLPIDKNSMQRIYREMVQHPSGQISDLVDLHRLGLPVTEENLTQMESYKNLTHQLVSGLAETSQSLMDTISSLTGQGREDQAAQLLLDVMEVMGEADGALTSETALGEAAEGVLEQDPAKADLQEGETAKTLQAQNTLADGDELLQAGTGEKVSELPAPQQSFQQLLDGLAGGADQASKTALSVGENAGDTVQSDMPALTKEQYLSTITDVLKQEYTLEQKTDFVSQLLKESISSGNKELTKALLDSPDVKKLLGQQFDKQWTITPQQVQDPKEVENLYRRLDRQLRGLSNALDQAGQTQSVAFQNCSNMNQNLDFLNQLNQMFAYVQLPLKLQQGEAHGDLYVYTNKRNLASKDGPITALLHLDMDNLGPLDVYVTMQNDNVGTKFTVQDDEILDFLEEHMELLTARLEKRGYQLSVQTSVKSKDDTETQSGVHPILAGKNAGGVRIQARGFDVRA